MAKILSMIDMSFLDEAYELVKVELTEKEFDDDSEFSLLRSLYPFYRYVYVLKLPYPSGEYTLRAFYLCSKSKTTCVEPRHVDFVTELLKFSYL